MYMKDSNGKKSFTVTISLITFTVVMIKVLVGGSAFNVNGVAMSFGTIGAPEIAALLGPTLFAYSFRRYTDRRYSGVSPDEADPGLADGGTFETEEVSA